MRMLVFISDAEGRGSFGFAMAQLCWRTSTALADSPPLLCPGPLALLIQHQHDQHTGTVPWREHSETPLFSLHSLLWNSFPGRSIPTASPGASSFRTASWLHRSGLSFCHWHEPSSHQTAPHALGSASTGSADVLLQGQIHIYMEKVLSDLRQI